MKDYKLGNLTYHDNEDNQVGLGDSISYSNLRGTNVSISLGSAANNKKVAEILDKEGISLELLKQGDLQKNVSLLQGAFNLRDKFTRLNDQRLAKIVENFPRRCNKEQCSLPERFYEAKALYRFLEENRQKPDQEFCKGLSEILGESSFYLQNSLTNVITEKLLLDISKKYLQGQCPQIQRDQFVFLSMFYYTGDYLKK